MVMKMINLMLQQDASTGSIYKSQNLNISRQYFPKPDPTGVNRSTIHTHPNFEILWVLKGSGFMHIEGTRYPLQPGSFYITRPREYHNIEMDPHTPYDRAVIYFSPDLFSSMDPDGEFLRAFLDHPLGILNHYIPPDHADLRYLSALLNPDTPRTELLLVLLRFLKELPSWCKKLPGQEETLEYQIIQYINNHLSEDLSVSTLCSRFFISRTQLYRRFQQITGLSIGDYVTARRLIAARSLLNRGFRPTEVCGMCGYHDYSAFYRAFQKHFGKSPSEI